MPKTSRSTPKEKSGSKKTPKGRTAAQQNRGNSPHAEEQAPPHSERPRNLAAEETLQKIKHLTAGALVAFSEIAAAYVRDTVNKGLQSKHAKAIKSNPVRAGLAAAGIAALAAAGVFGTQALVRKKSAKGTSQTASSAKKPSAKGTRKRSTGKAGR